MENACPSHSDGLSFQGSADPKFSISRESRIRMGDNGYRGFLVRIGGAVNQIPPPSLELERRIDSPRQVGSYPAADSILQESTLSTLANNMSIEQAVRVLTDACFDEARWQVAGVLLEVPYDEIKNIASEGCSGEKIRAMLSYCASPSGFLTSEKCVQTIEAIRSGDRYSLTPDCYQTNSKPEGDDRISPRDAYLTGKGLAPEAVYMLPQMFGLPLQDRLALLPLIEQWENYFCELLWRADQQRLLTHENFFAAVKALNKYYLCAEHHEKLGLANDVLVENSVWQVYPNFHSDFRVYPDDRVAALRQPLSIRNLVRVFVDTSDLPVEVLAQVTGHQDLLQDSLFLTCKENNALKKIVLLEKILEKKGSLTADEVIRVLHKPEVMEIALAQELAGALTGSPLSRTVINHRRVQVLRLIEALVKDDVVAPGKFGEAMGIPSNRLMAVLQSGATNNNVVFIQIFLAAEQLSRLTPENIVYALHKAYQHRDLLTELLEQPDLSWLKEVDGCELPQDAPVYLSSSQAEGNGPQV